MTRLFLFRFRHLTNCLVELVDVLLSHNKEKKAGKEKAGCICYNRLRFIYQNNFTGLNSKGKYRCHHSPDKFLLLLLVQ